jgi:hypothetical protein
LPGRIRNSAHDVNPFQKIEIDGPPLRLPGFICIEDGPEGVRGDDRVVQTLLEFLLFIPADYFLFLRLPLAHLLRFDGRKNRRRNITRPGLRAGRRPRKFQTTIVKFFDGLQLYFFDLFWRVRRLLLFGRSNCDWSVSFSTKRKMATVTLLLRFTFFFSFKTALSNFFLRMEREWKNLLEKLEELPFGLEGFTSPTHYVK